MQFVQPSPWGFSLSLERAQSTHKSLGTGLVSVGDVTKFRAKSVSGNGKPWYEPAVRRVKIAQFAAPRVFLYPNRQVRLQLSFLRFNFALL